MTNASSTKRKADEANAAAGKELLKAIQMYDFYLVDLNLFLDTHPNDRRALDKFEELTEKREKAYETYIAKYGPLTAAQSSADEHFSWADGPWPWERSAE